MTFPTSLPSSYPDPARTQALYKQITNPYPNNIYPHMGLNNLAQALQNDLTHIKMDLGQIKQKLDIEA